jgi:glutathione S-transferase
LLKHPDLKHHDMAKRTDPRLITLPLSHYCEKARWALDLAGIEYHEERHLPLIHRLHTRRAGGTSVPVLVTVDAVLTDSAAIVRYADRHSRRLRLLPSRAADRQEAAELERYFDRELGPHSRRWAYFHMLGRIGLLSRAASAGVARPERFLASPVMLVVRPLIRRGYRVGREAAERSLQRVQEVFRAVDARLADGARYLVADELSAADITFAALASPVLLPERPGGPALSPDEIPAAMYSECLRLRSTPAGAYALRLYEQHRQA